MSSTEQMSDVELIEHILTRYHDRHREQLPELIRLSKRVELVHGGVPACPAGLTALLEKLQDELNEHMRREEEILFPMILRGLGAALAHPVEIMRHEHDFQHQLLTEIQLLTHGVVLPQSACTTWRALYNGLSQLIADLADHLQLENQVLFARVDALKKEPSHG